MRGPPGGGRHAGRCGLAQCGPIRGQSVHGRPGRRARRRAAGGAARLGHAAHLGDQSATAAPASRLPADLSGPADGACRAAGPGVQAVHYLAAGDLARAEAAVAALPAGERRRIGAALLGRQRADREDWTGAAEAFVQAADPNRLVRVVAALVGRGPMSRRWPSGTGLSGSGKPTGPQADRLPIRLAAARHRRADARPPTATQARRGHPGAAGHRRDGHFHALDLPRAGCAPPGRR